MPANPTDNLFLLIQSLTDELKEVRQHLKGAKRTDQLKLFNIIKNQKLYNEKEIAVAMPGKNIAVLKFRLNRSILDAVRCESKELFPKDTVRRMMKDADFLQSKGLYKQSEMTLIDAIKEAEKHELLTDQLELIDRQKELVQSRQTYEIKSSLKELLIASAIVRRKIENMYYYRDLYDRLYTYQYTSVTLSKLPFGERLYFKRCLGHRRMSDVSQALSFQATKYFYQAQSIYQQLAGDDRQALYYLEQVVLLWETRLQAMQGYSIQGYIKALANYAGVSLFKKSTVDFSTAIEKLKRTKMSTVDDEAEKLQNLVHLQILDHINNYRFEEAKRIFIQNQPDLAKYAKRFNPSRLITIFYNVIIVLAFCGNYEEAIRWIREIQNPGKTSKFFRKELLNIRVDIRVALCILELPMRLEKSEADSFNSDDESEDRNESDGVNEFDNALRRSQEYLKKVEQNHLYDRSVLSLVNSLIKLMKDLARVDNSRRSAIYKKLKVAIEDYRQKHNRLPVGIEELLWWINSKLLKKSYAYICRNRKL